MKMLLAVSAAILMAAVAAALPAPAGAAQVPLSCGSPEGTSDLVCTATGIADPEMSAVGTTVCFSSTSGRLSPYPAGTPSVPDPTGAGRVCVLTDATTTARVLVEGASGEFTVTAEWVEPRVVHTTTVQAPTVPQVAWVGETVRLVLCLGSDEPANPYEAQWTLTDWSGDALSPPTNATGTTPRSEFLEDEHGEERLCVARDVTSATPGTATIKVVVSGESPSAIYEHVWLVVWLELDRDADDDGIEDAVDADPANASSSFADLAGTSGTVVDTGALAVTVTDAADPDGVRVTAGAGTGAVRLSVCGGFTVKLAAGSSVVVTCGSVRVAVEQGSAQIVLGDGLATVSLDAGETAKVAETGDGTFAVTEIGGGIVTVTVDGVASNLAPAPGASYAVAAWDFEGFFAPLDALPAVNVAKAGRAIPLKWRLRDAAGNGVATLESVRVRVDRARCDTGAPLESRSSEVAAGESALQNLGDGYYQFNWKTPSTYAGSCATLRLDVGDGVTHDAALRFVK